jgi:WD40 repeat protein
VSRGGIKWGVGIALGLALVPVAAGSSQLEKDEERGTVMLPAPRIVLRDREDSSPPSTVALDPSRQSGTIAVSGGNEGNLVLDVAFSPDGKWLLAGRFRGQLEVWKTDTWTRILSWQADQDRVTALATSPDGQTAASGGDDNTVKIWRIATGEMVVKVRKCDDYPDELVFSPDGRLLAVVVNGGPDFVYDLGKLSVVKKLLANGFAFSTSGDVLASSLATSISFWDVKTWKVIRELSDPGGHISKLALDARERHLVAGVWQGVTKIWDVSTGEPVAHLDTGYVAALFVSGDGRWIYSAGDGFIRLWSTRSAKQVCASPEQGLWDLDLSRDGRWVAAAVGDSIHIWPTEDILEVCEEGGH